MEVPIRILVVDDEPDIRNVLRLLLTSRGYSVEEAANGREALEQVQKNAYDLIILDIMMPEMNGVDACAALREISSAPVLFLTAKDQDADKQEAFHSGGDDYLVKPFSNQELFLRVEALVRRYRVYKGKGEAPTLISSLEVNRERGAVSCSCTSSKTAARRFRRARSMKTSGRKNIFLPRPTPSWCTSSSSAKSWRTIQPIPS